MKKPILIWDIDGTLSSSADAGINALSRAIEQHFPNASAPTLDLAGATDGGIYRTMCERYHTPYRPEKEQAFYALYLPILEQNLSSGEYQTSLYPTVLETLEYFRDQNYTQGLLTGNIEHGAYLKNHVHGITSFFSFGAYGGDHWDRNKLGFIVAQRATAHLGEHVSPTDLLIIGDTIKDIACARACGAKVAAITTGHGKREELSEADWVIDHAADLLSIVAH